MWATLSIDSEPPQLSESSLITSPSDTMIADSSSSSIPSRLSQRRTISCPSLTITDESDSRRYKHRSSSLTYYNTEQLQSIFRNQQPSEYPVTSDQNTPSSGPKPTRERSREKSVDKSFSFNEISELDFDHLPNSANQNTTNTPTSSPSFSTNNWLQRLSPDDMTWLEEENSFLHFVCVSILLAHRNFLLKQENLDEQEISMHFDRYRRRHNAEKILACARILYGQYLQRLRKKRTIDDLNRHSGN